MSLDRGASVFYGTGVQSFTTGSNPSEVRDVGFSRVVSSGLCDESITRLDESYRPFVFNFV
jgi:hypothetical protein